MSPQSKLKFDAIMVRVEKYGLSLVLLVLGICWLIPKIDTLFDKHIQFMEKTETTQQQQAETQVLGVQVLKQIDGKVETTRDLVRDMHNRMHQPQPVGAHTAIEAVPDPDATASP